MSLRHLAAALGIALAWPLAAVAHQASDAYLRAGADPQGQLALQVDVALRDLDVALELDADGDGKLSWGEVRRRERDIADHVAAHLRLDDGRCRLAPRPGLALDRKADGVYAVLHYASDCLAAAQPRLAYSLFRDLDPTHRGLLLTLDAQGRASGPLRSLVPGGEAVPVLRAAAGEAAATPGPPAGAGFFAEGLHHILIGADHVLFLVCLILPLALAPRRGPTAPGRLPTVPPRPALWGPVLALVTAFTVAHSITLGLAAWRVLSVPPSIIEPLIAATIAVAALDNLWPVLGRRRVAAAFAFGLVHGFGFAGPLLELQLPPLAMAAALLKFNLGVEAGQLLVVTLAIALLWPLRGRAGPAGWALRGGSAMAGLLALVWLGERLLNVRLLPI